jgi:hypothetical protein
MQLQLLKNVHCGIESLRESWEAVIDEKIQMPISTYDTTRNQYQYWQAIKSIGIPT